jgi:hypothetical protein
MEGCRLVIGLRAETGGRLFVNTDGVSDLADLKFI